MMNEERDVARWLKRAEECLTLAETFRLGETREILRGTAAAYSQMVEQALARIESREMSAS